jgi:hypothetical protein
VLKTMVDGLQDTASASIALERDQLPLARDAAVRTVQALQALHPQPGFEDVEDYICQFIAGDAAGRASYLMGEFAAAEKYERVAVEARQKFLTDAVGDRRDLMIKTTWLAMAVARQGRLAEAAQIIAPAVGYQRELSRHNHGDQWLPIELAQGIYAQALSEPARREALLREAASLLDSAAAEIRPLHDVRLLRQLVESALHGKAPSST